MAQPKILTSQAAVGTASDQFTLYSDVFLGASPPGSGRIIKSVHGTLGGLTGTSTIPFDNSIPLISEGTEFGTFTYTKQYSDTHMHFNFSCLLDAGSNNTSIVVAVFRDTTCIAASVVAIDTAGRPKNFALTGEDSALPIGSYTYSTRVGSDLGQAWYINQLSTGTNLGNTIKSTWILGEYATYTP